jgi:tetratricopeptide (TPR) repeat protein
MRDHANARLAYERTLARDPKHVLALHNLGLLNHFELGDEEEAERLLKRALQIHPLMPIANFVLGDIAVTTGDYSEAIGYFNQEIESFLHYDSADRSLPIADAIRRFALQKSHYRLAILYSTRHPDRKLAQLNLNHYLRLEPDKTMRRKAIGEMKRYWVTR